MNIRVDPEFESWLEAFEPARFALLEANIKADGCREPLVVWDGVLVDGHHRFKICMKLGITPKVVQKQFKDRVEALTWMIDNDEGRRKSTPFSKAERALKLEPMLREEGSKRRVEGGRRKHLSKVTKALDTRETVARVAGLSPITIQKAKIIAAHAPEPVKAALRAGTTTINREYNELKKKQRADATVETLVSPNDRTTRLRSNIIMLLESVLETSQEDKAFVFIKKPVKGLITRLRKDR